jgi:uroporphyrinogen decarboxylase
MNSIERVVIAISQKEPDHVPVYPILGGVTRHLVGADYKTWATDADVCSAAFIKAAQDFDIDCVVSLVDLSIECDAWGQELIFPENEASHPNYNNCVITSLKDYQNIKKVDYRSSERMMFHIDVCKKLVQEVGQEKPIVGFVFGPLGVLSMLRHQQDLYMDIYDDPDAVKSATFAINETLKDYVNALIDTGIHAIMLDTLFASGSIMSKDMWKEMEGAYVKELADICHERGVMVMIHNCGKDIYFDVQIEAMKPEAISFLYPPDDCKDFAECKAKYGDKVSLIGCVPPVMVVASTDEEWDAYCKKQIDLMAKGGGFMLATGCEYPANAPFDRARQMIDIAKNYGCYSNLS